MNGFLVVLRCTADDIPLSLHATRAEALAAAVKGARDPSLVDAVQVGQEWNPGKPSHDHYVIVEFAAGDAFQCDSVELGDGAANAGFDPDRLFGAVAGEPYAAGREG